MHCDACEGPPVAGDTVPMLLVDDSAGAPESHAAIEALTGGGFAHLSEHRAALVLKTQENTCVASCLL